MIADESLRQFLQVLEQNGVEVIAELGVSLEILEELNHKLVA